jgi:hypothetical protein
MKAARSRLSYDDLFSLRASALRLICDVQLILFGVFVDQQIPGGQAVDFAIAHVGASEIGFGKLNTLQICTVQMRTPEVGLVEIRAAEICTLKMCLGTIRLCEDRLVEVCTLQAEAAEIRFGEVGVAEIVAVKWSAGCVPQVSQVCSGEHRMQVRVAKPPFVPSISSRC